MSVGNHGRKHWGGVAVIVAAALVLAVRLLGFEWVFVGDLVIFPPADPQYHLRRALAVYHEFPSVILYDHYINHPGGAPVPWPPLFDWLVGGFAWLFARDEHGFEVVAAWVSPICAFLTCLPIVLIVRRASPHAGRAIGSVAVAIFALVPILVNYARIGYFDHHAAVAMIGAWLLFCVVALVDPTLTRDRSRKFIAAHVIVRLALLLTWHGSLLYLGVSEAILALWFVASGRTIIASAQAMGAAITAILVLPVLYWMPEPLGGDYSAIALSRLHVLAMSGVAFVVGLGAWTSTRFDFDESARRLGTLAGFAALFITGLLLLPELRAGLDPALEFLTMTDGVGDVTGEQSPLFVMGERTPLIPASVTWGWLAPLIPMAPLMSFIVGWRQPAGSAGRSAAWAVSLWVLVFGALALSQRRYGNDFGPSAAVAFAMGFTGLGHAVASVIPALRLRAVVAWGIAMGLVIATAWPPITQIYLPRLQFSLASMHEGDLLRRATSTSIAGTLTRFLLDVRRATPETAGYFESGIEPQYGVIAHPNLGHAIQYVARRATATDPFWAYIGPENWERTLAFITVSDEDKALKLAEELNGRYVVSTPDQPRGSVMDRLHRFDGGGRRKMPPLARFRFLTEAPAGGLTVDDLFASQPVRDEAPYKLFEVVKGAEIAVPCAPDQLAQAVVIVRTQTGREFTWGTRRASSDSDVASFRVPYPTRFDSASPGAGIARAVGPYRVKCGERAWPVHVPLAAVRTGGTITVTDEPL